MPGEERTVYQGSRSLRERGEAPPGPFVSFPRLRIGSPRRYVHEETDPQRRSPDRGPGQDVRPEAAHVGLAAGGALPRRGFESRPADRRGTAAGHPKAARSSAREEDRSRRVRRPSGTEVPLRRVLLDTNVVLDFVLD